MVNTLNVGDLVYCLDKTKAVGRSKKLEPIIWQGPFVVSRKISDLLFEIKTQKKLKSVHHDKLKRFTSDIIPAWAQNFRENLKMDVSVLNENLMKPSKQRTRTDIRPVAKERKRVKVHSFLRRGGRLRKQTDFFRAEH